ncbi:toll-like receptor 13 [Branchiostoma floridae]|uniref:Toll-like receptor 13 n=2 Tax=Branchiostoma floridae TaxID=7739 RepID=A0A9J7M290_BRAFL|nr:toll-like receptor 13 [Branchiostoma floridae]
MLTVLSSRVFKSLSSLQRLQLDRNMFKSTASIAASLHPLLSLNILNLNYNKLSCIHLEPAFATLANLNTINLAGNLHLSLQAESFQVMRNHSLTHLNLGSNNLINISQALKPFASIKQLGLSNNRLTTEDLFAIFNNTRGLGITNWTLTNNALTELTNVTFSPLLNEEVIYLSLHNNNISKLTDYLFAFLPTLRVLSFGVNPVERLSSKVFAGCGQLQELALNNVSLHEIPSELFEPLANLTKLNLDSNFIGIVRDKAFASLPKLRILRMNGNRIEMIRNNAFYGLYHLEELNLGTNNLRYIPSHALGVLGMSLKNLDLSANRRLQKIPPNSLSKLHNLTDLRIQSCQLKILQNNNFAGLYNLQRLDLSFNSIKTIDPDAFYGLFSIKVLSLNNNYLGRDTRIRPSPFRYLISLTELHAVNQMYTGIFPDGYLDGLTSLRLLSLISQRLISLESKTGKNSILKNLTHLRYLQLSRNTISHLTRDTFAGLTNLRHLYLRSNSIRALPIGVFRQQASLQYLDLSYNGIVTLTSSVFSPLKSLIALQFYSNSLSCTCAIEWFHDWVASSMNATTGVQGAYFEAYKNYTCASPKTLRNKPLIDINFEKLGCRSKLSVYMAIGSSCTILILMVTITLLAYRYRWYGRYAMFLLRAKFNKYELIKEEEENPKTYDAFLAHNSNDSAWVIHQLLPQLERGDPPEFRLCLGDRDFQPGAPIVDNIAESIYESRKTICVITRDFLESDWCRFEMQMATYRLFEEHVDCLIVVFLEQIPAQRLAKYHSLRRVMCRNTYLEWPEEPEARDLFWERLRVALRTHRPLDHDVNA